MGTGSDTMHFQSSPSNDTSLLPRLERRLPPLLSVVAGMVDLIGFLSLGNLFTAHPRNICPKLTPPYPAGNPHKTVIARDVWDTWFGAGTGMPL